MEPTSVIGFAILIFTGLVTYQGFREFAYLNKYVFDVDRILIDKEYYRLFSSGFLHASWLHFGFNMIALMSFSYSLEILFGLGKFTVLYFGSMLGASLLSLYIHRNHADYRALGASGAISGVIFASVVLFPDHNISFVIIPLEIKSWVMGILFVAISILGIKKQSDNIGHEAHLGGAITGVLITMLIEPAVLQDNLWIVLAILVPCVFFLLLLIRNPAVLMIEDYWGETLKKPSLKKQKVETKKSREEELNILLEKIKRVGVEGLQEAEKKRLQELTEGI